MRRKTFIVLLACMLAVSVTIGFASCRVKEVTCVQCQGTGKCSSCNGIGQDYDNHTCGTCQGSGKCYRCKGTGTYKY